MPTRTLVFTDLVDSTRITGRLGDQAAAAMWAEHDRRARDLLARHHGIEIDRSDGFFMLFPSADAAAGLIVGYHRMLAGLGLRARVGLHTGEVALRSNTPEDIARGAKRLEVEGLAKPLAARIMSLARAGQTLLCAAAAQAAQATAHAAETRSHGHYRLKGIDDPVELFELGESGSSFVPPQDAEKAYRVVRRGDLWLPAREVRHNLAPERDAFVGRAAELSLLASRLDSGSRLLTLLGAGSIGKTRLVRRFGLSWLGSWPGGVHFCDLSEARSEQGVLFAVATALGVPLGKDEPGAQIGHAIAARGRCLVILDNVEQVAEPVRTLLGRWLDLSRQAVYLTTSRERLRMAGEEVFPVRPLAPDDDAITLFEVRARAQRPDFGAGPEARAAIAELVRLLDGLPLAIELAAARIGVFSPRQVVARLGDRFRVLAGAAGAPARQATLEAAIDWSWRLLAPWEQAALAQCAVFEGGFTMAAAEQVLDLGAWPKAPPVMDLVQSLVDKSLLSSKCGSATLLDPHWGRPAPAGPAAPMDWAAGGSVRYDIDEPHFAMYLSIHEYAAVRLRESGCEAAAQVRHGRYFARFGRRDAIDALYTHGGIARLHALAREIDNLVAACRRAAARGDAKVALPALQAAWELLSLSGPYIVAAELAAMVTAIGAMTAAEAVPARITQALIAWRQGQMASAFATLTALAQQQQQQQQQQQPGDEPRAEADLLRWLAVLHQEHGQDDLARGYYERAIDRHRAAGNRLDEGRTRANLGKLHAEQGRLEDARREYEQAFAIARERGNLRGEAEVALLIGNLDYLQGRLDSAQQGWSHAITLCGQTGDRGLQGLITANLVAIFETRGDMAAAIAHCDQALALVREVGNRRFEGFVLNTRGTLCHAQGRFGDARLDFEQSLTLLREAGSRLAESYTLGAIGDLEREQGRPDAAIPYFEAALALGRASGFGEVVGESLRGLAEVYLLQRRDAEAQTALAEAEAVLRSGNNPQELGKVLAVRGRLELGLGDAARAARTLGEAEAIAASIDAASTSALGRTIAELRQALAETRPP